MDVVGSKQEIGGLFFNRVVVKIELIYFYGPRHLTLL